MNTNLIENRPLTLQDFNDFIKSLQENFDIKPKPQKTYTVNDLHRLTKLSKSAINYQIKIGNIAVFQYAQKGKFFIAQKDAQEFLKKYNQTK